MIHCVESLSDSCSVPSHGMLSLDKSYFFPSKSAELCQLQQAQRVALLSLQKSGSSADQSCQQHKSSANWSASGSSPCEGRTCHGARECKANSSPLPSQNRLGSFIGWSVSGRHCVVSVLQRYSLTTPHPCTSLPPVYVKAQDHNHGFL